VSKAARETHARWTRRVAASAALGVALSVSTLAHADPSKLPPDYGYNYDEIETARVAGTAGAVRTFSNSLTALFVNPANLAAARVYHVGAFASIWPEASRQSYGVGAVDSIVSSARIAGGVGATWNFQDLDGVNRKWTDLRFGLAYPISDQFFMGVGGRYMWLSEDGVGPLGTSLASSGLADKKIVRGFAFDAGMTLKASQNLSLSIVGTNLNNPDHGFQPTGVGGGVGLAFGDFSGEADLVADFTSWSQTTLRPMVGIEGLFVDHVAARAGYRYDDGAKNHTLAIGAGYVDKTFDFDLSMHRSVSGPGVTAIVFGFSYHLDATGLTPSPSDSF
jgi:opacity protein-like surface antigen